MGSFQSAKAFYGLTATGVPAGTKIDGNLTLGQVSSRSELVDCDIFYAFQFESAGVSDQIDLDLTDLSVTATVGSPTITDGDGNDFEGVDLPNVERLQSILILSAAGNTGDLNTLNQTSDSVLPTIEPGGFIHVSGSAAITNGGTTSTDLSFFPTASGDTFTVIVAATTTTAAP